MERTTLKFSPPFFVLVAGIGLGFVSIIATDRTAQLGFGVAGVAVTLASLYLLVDPKGVLRTLALASGIASVLGMGIVSASVIASGSVPSMSNDLALGLLAVAALSLAAGGVKAFIADNKPAQVAATV